MLLRHPELGVLMCTKCYKCYGRGGWTKDGEGNDEYCRYLESLFFYFVSVSKQSPFEVVCHYLICYAYLLHMHPQVVLRRGTDLPLRLLPAGAGLFLGFKD